MGKMQEIADRYSEAKKRQRLDLQVDALWDAVLLLSKGQQQVMSDVRKVHVNTDDIPIGGDHGL